MVVIILGSSSDLDFASKITDKLDEFEVEHTTVIASAHKSVKYLLNILEHFNLNYNENLVYITVAGMSNALSGVVDCNSFNPVISCPPLNKDNIDIDVWSSLRTPSDVCPSVILNPANAALHAAKILGISNSNLKKSIIALQSKNEDKIKKHDINEKNCW